MLSRIAAPNESGPPDGSWPSSKTMRMRWTVLVTGGNAVAGSQRSRVRRATDPVEAGRLHLVGAAGVELGRFAAVETVLRIRNPIANRVVDHVAVRIEHRVVGGCGDRVENGEGGLDGRHR